MRQEIALGDSRLQENLQMIEASTL